MASAFPLATNASGNEDARFGDRVHDARRLKLCFISETFFAGTGRHVAELAAALAGRGHQIHVLYSPTRANPAFVEALSTHANIVTAPLGMPRSIGFADIAALRRIHRYVAEHGPFDAIHGHSSKGGAYARMLGLFGHGPAIYTPHAFATMSPTTSPVARLVYRLIERGLAACSDLIICISQMEYQHARALGIARFRLALIANGTEFEIGSRAAARQRLGVPSDSVVVGFVGRMNDQKAPERVIAAAHDLAPGNANLVFVMIGAGERKAALENVCRQCGLGDRVRWLGEVEARLYMPGFDMLVMPSRYEGFSYTLIEALHIGLPIIATEVGGTTEAIEDGANGLIVPQEPAQPLTDAIRRLAGDRRLRLAMGAQSRLRAGRFTLQRTVEDTENQYRRLIGAPALSRAPALPTADNELAAAQA